ncbi:MAG: argininosuccinate lyase [Thermoplasmatota archaeon]
MNPVWATRTGQDASESFLAYSETTQDDAPYLTHDIVGSIAHVIGLAHADLLTQGEATRLIQGLQDVPADLPLNPALEDVHMNLETHLTATLGDVGKKLHTGRSRNDQVATCLVLHARQGLLAVATQAQAVAQALTEQAKRHQQTPWVATTHGQPAQPATLGFLLAAHAFRFQALAQQASHAFDTIGQSPLGAGAVAGSTLPLNPAFTAQILGLRAHRNALLSTGTRDTSITAIHVAGQAGFLAASLAQDLLQLFGNGHMQLPHGFTTGSSLMPQKRNPDALELIRGHGKTLAALPATAIGLASGLGLGYMRDLQAMKPIQTQALGQSTVTLQVLAQAIHGATLEVPENVLEIPGITATDAAEALVAAGMPFRDAYQALAAAFQAVEQGATPEAALHGQDLPPAALESALAALKADPGRRATLGGPAPVQVALQVEQLHAAAAALAPILAAMQASVDQATTLAMTPAEELLA